MNNIKHFSAALGILIASVFITACSEVEFTALSSIEKPLICDPLSPDGVITDCSALENGLIGEIRYFLDKDPATTIPATVFDRFDHEIAFPSGITEVQQFEDFGFLLNAKLVLSSVNKPSIRFTEGFRDSSGNLVADEVGNPLFEAFSFKLKSYLQLRNTQEEGLYEIGLISDDGATFRIDTDGDGILELAVDGDGTHATRFSCGLKAVELKRGQPLPIEINYYQGPRQHIALVMVMRKIASVDDISVDPLCGHTSTTAWFGDTAKPDYQPDYVNSKFGEIVSRGWFIPTTEMFVLPKN